MVAMWGIGSGAPGTLGNSAGCNVGVAVEVVALYVGCTLGCEVVGGSVAAFVWGRTL